MRSSELVAVLAASLLPEPGASARREPAVGQEHHLIRSYETSRLTDDGSSGSSRGRDVVLERVVGVRDGGLELEYDLPKDAEPAERARTWQFPVRVFRSKDGSLRLLNQGALEARADAWLKKAGLTRAACGSTVFTWNVFRIDCDPSSALSLVEMVDFGVAELREGAPHRERQALGSGTLKRTAGPDGVQYVAVLEIDPDAIRRTRAEGDIAVGPIVGEPVTLDAALRERAKEKISGTISVTFHVDAAGGVRQRTKVTRIKIEGPKGRSEETIKETLERRVAPSS